MTADKQYGTNYRFASFTLRPPSPLPRKVVQWYAYGGISITYEPKELFVHLGIRNGRKAALLPIDQ